jgi:hypothetical protein
MRARDKIPKHLPCYKCLVVSMCIGKPISDLFDNCPILSDWFDAYEKGNSNERSSV